MKPKIVITKDLALSPENIKRLEKLGDLKIYNELSKTPEEWVERCQEADIICTGKFGLKQKYQELKNVYISLPFVGVGFFDKAILKKNNITVSNSPGCNKDGVSEWIVFMLLNLFREFYDMVNVKDRGDKKLKETKSLVNRSVCILGKGNIGTKVGRVCEALDMAVKYFTRGDNLIESVKNADVVINCLTTNETTLNLLDKDFFFSFKKGSYFISVCDYVIYDIDSLIRALDEGVIERAAIDAMGIQVGDTADPFYKKILAHDKILATPHIAWNADISNELGNKMMIDNIEAWIKGEPINVI
ncbi:MAG: NAD(P)-dependent oxidoreductase [Patescibacteria group bacterium]